MILFAVCWLPAISLRMMSSALLSSSASNLTENDALLSPSSHSIQRSYAEKEKEKEKMPKRMMFPLHGRDAASIRVVWNIKRYIKLHSKRNMYSSQTYKHKISFRLFESCHFASGKT